jgi:signal peptidase I
LLALFFRVKGESMLPSFRRRELLIVKTGAYRSASPFRGDPVIVRAPGDRARHFLKRVVGLPGEEVRLSEGMLFVDGERLAEPYLGGLPASPGLVENAWNLGDGQCFVMGDNRAHSTDSRDFGPVGYEDVLGRVWFRVWPPGRLGAVG